MAVNVQYEPNSAAVIATVEGRVSAEDLESIKSGAELLLDRHHSRKLLIDARKRTALPPVMAQSDFCTALACSGVFRASRLAVVMPEGMNDNDRFLENSGVLLGLRIATFTSTEDALLWLAGKERAVARFPAPADKPVRSERFILFHDDGGD